MNWYHRKVKESNVWVEVEVENQTLKYLSLMALLDLSWMAEIFYQTVTCDVEKIFIFALQSF